MGKEKKINVLTAFFISHKSDVKTFFNWILNECPKSTRLHFPIIIYSRQLLDRQLDSIRGEMTFKVHHGMES